MTLAFLAGCRSDAIVQPMIPDPDQIYWQLDVNHPTVMLSVHAPYDTVQLAATPVNLRGDPVSGHATVGYRNLAGSDTAVTVSATGFITARYPTTSNSRIEVSAVVGNVTHVDTVLVMVRNDPSVRHIDSVTFRPRGADSSWRWQGLTFGSIGNNIPSTWVQVFANGSATPVAATQRLVHYSYEDRELVECVGMDIGGTGCELLGETYIRAEVYAYGRTLRDSVLFRRIEPAARAVVFRTLLRPDGSQEAAFYPRELRIKKGNTVFFINRGVVTVSAGTTTTTYGQTYGSPMRTFLSGATPFGYVDSTDVVFDDPTKALPGAAFGRLRHTQVFFDICLFNNFNCLTATFTASTSGGNIAAFGHVWLIGRAAGLTSGTETDMGWRSRRFNDTGVIHYSSTRYPGATGTIIVTD